MRVLREVIGALVLALFFTGAVRAQFVDGIQAVVHETPVTYIEVAEMSRSAVETMARQFGGRQEQFQRQVSEVMSNNLDHLVRNQLILQEFKTYNVPETILDKDVDKAIQERIQKDFYGDRTRMIKSLQAEGMTLEDLRRRTRERFIEIALRQKNVGSEVIVSPHKIEVYYLAHKEEYKMDDEVKLRMIVLTNSPGSEGPDPRRLAAEIITKLDDGTPFIEMARLYSQGSQARADGDWGWYEARKLRKEFSEAASKLKPGEHSGVLQTSDACYVMLVEDRKPGHYKSLGEVRDEIETNLRLDEESRLERQWIAKLKKKTFVKYYQ